MLSARIAAAERLSEPDPGFEAQAVEALVTLASNENVQVRRTALRSLATIGSARVQASNKWLSSLVECLRDEDATARELAVIAISEIDDEKADKLLRDALKNSHPEVRFQAVQAFARRAADGIEKEVRELLKDPDAKVRAIAGRTLGEVGGPSARKALIRLLEDPTDEVRGEAALALSKSGEKKAAPVLCAALSDPSMVFEALQGLADLKSVESSDRIAELTRGLFRPIIVKAAAARALVRLGDRRGVEALREVITARRWEGRNLAVQTVGELGIVALAKELRDLAKRLRGTDPQLLARALADLAPQSQNAFEGLQILSRRKGNVGDPARQELSRLFASAKQRVIPGKKSADKPGSA